MMLSFVAKCKYRLVSFNISTSTELWNTYVFCTKIQQTTNYIYIVTGSEQRRVSTNDEELERQELDIITPERPVVN
jgi:hypothetical protein